MTARIFKFTPGGQERAARCVAGAKAAVVPFPSALHVLHVPNVVAMMRGCANDEAAKECLASHIDFWWDRLDDLGVAGEASEADCRAFAMAAYGAYFRGDDDSYGAA